MLPFAFRHFLPARFIGIKQGGSEMPAIKHHYHSPLRRGIFSFFLVAAVMVVGTVGMHLIEGLSYVDSFYFMSMIATAQGPTFAPATTAGKIFASLIAFVSVGSVVAALGFLFGPFFGKLWKVGIEKFEEEMEHLRRKK